MKGRVEEAAKILGQFGLPSAQCNERSALTFLALAGVGPKSRWRDASGDTHRTVDLMAFMRAKYGKDYKPNTRETIRRQTLHQFEQARVVDRNPDDPARPTNSGKNCYRLTDAALQVATSYGAAAAFDAALARFQSLGPALKAEYAGRKAGAQVVVHIPERGEVRLSPGKHNELARSVIDEFLPRFARDSRIAYVGDTAKKDGHHERELLLEIGVPFDIHGKFPDVVLFDARRDWLFLIECVTTHGPVDAKRHKELRDLVVRARPGPVFVSAFPDRRTYRKYAADLAWETEAWIAAEPEHLIHLNGDRFLGPHRRD